jgi:hypothetical protein
MAMLNVMRDIIQGLGHMAPMSKHYGIKLQWLRTKFKPNEIESIHISTNRRWADFLMKSLQFENFEENHKRTCGW